jgi:hypothetical protein
MSRPQAVASSPPATGITRDCDLTLWSSSGAMEIGAGVGMARAVRSMGDASATGINISSVSTIFGVDKYNRLVADIPSGLGNGTMIQYGIPVTTLLPLNHAAYGLRRGITRMIATLSSDVAATPNNDVGMQFVIGGGTLAQLYANNNVTGAGKSGFGIWMVAGKWIWGGKLVNTAQFVLSETVDLGLDVLEPSAVEVRVYDAVDSLKPAKVEVWVNNVLFLTRYWVNPAGVVTPVLPPFGAALGAAIYAQIRNTSLGPTHARFGDFSLIHGPNNEGTI